MVLSEFETNADGEYSVRFIVWFLLALRVVNSALLKYFNCDVKNALPWWYNRHSTGGEWSNAIKLRELASLAGSKYFSRGNPPPPRLQEEKIHGRKLEVQEINKNVSIATARNLCEPCRAISWHTRSSVRRSKFALKYEWNNKRGRVGPDLMKSVLRTDSNRCCWNLITRITWEIITCKNAHGH
jgi:hypothetical protein